MSQSCSVRRLAALSLATAGFWTSQSVLAHTVIRDQAKEGQSLYTATVITHGCAAGEGGAPIPVIAQSVVFPNNADSILTRLDTKQTVNLSDVVEGAAPVLSISPAMGQDKNIFRRQEKVIDAGVLVGPHSVPNARAFNYWKGKLRIDVQGYLQASPNTC